MAGGSGDFRRTLRTQLRKLNNAQPNEHDASAAAAVGFSAANLNSNSNNPTVSVAPPRDEVSRRGNRLKFKSGGDDGEDAELADIVMGRNRNSLFFLGGEKLDQDDRGGGADDGDTRESSPTQMSVDSGNGASLKSASVSPIPPKSIANNSSSSNSNSNALLALKQKEQRKKLTAGLFQPVNAPPKPNNNINSSANNSNMANNSRSSSQLDRMRSYNRNLRRAKSFRGGLRERSLSGSGRNNLNTNNNVSNSRPRSMTFAVSKSKFGRIGWKVMPAEDNVDLRSAPAAVERVMAKIRDLEFSGKAVPEHVTVSLE